MFSKRILTTGQILPPWHSAHARGRICPELDDRLVKSAGQDAVNVGDEGGFAPNVPSSDDALHIIVEAIDKAGYKDKVRMSCKLDILVRMALSEHA